MLVKLAARIDRDPATVTVNRRRRTPQRINSNEMDVAVKIPTAQSSSLQLRSDPRHNLVGSPCHLVVPESEDPKSQPLEPLAPTFVVALRLAVLFPINLNDEALLEANEINDIGAYGDLASESHAGDSPPPQATP